MYETTMELLETLLKLTARFKQSNLTKPGETMRKHKNYSLECWEGHNETPDLWFVCYKGEIIYSSNNKLEAVDNFAALAYNN